MSRVITFSRVFPSYHPRKGEPTRFIEKIYAGLADNSLEFKIPNEANDYWDWYEYYNCNMPKFHTMRAGNRWKAGDKFSPRVWSGRPRQSKQIIIAPDIEIKKCWSITINPHKERKFTIHVGDSYVAEWKNTANIKLWEVAENDGLSTDDFKDWFGLNKEIIKPFSGQIICWNENIYY